MARSRSNELGRWVRSRIATHDVRPPRRAWRIIRDELRANGGVRVPLASSYRNAVDEWTGKVLHQAGAEASPPTSADVKAAIDHLESNGSPCPKP
jgi:hypothetical protein